MLLKRIFDIFASLLGLVLLSPLFVFVAVWVKLDSKGLVFYCSERGGRWGRPFRIYKFRSMIVNADKKCPMSTANDDDRITRSGKFIRKFKLDEISQLINVLIGDMSLVGYRPDIITEVAKYSDDERKIFELRPGITDWASIWNSDEGSVLEGAKDADAVYQIVLRPTKVKLQLYYREHRTFCTDLKIIFCTIYRIINKKFIPKELKNYPSFEILRLESEKLIAQGM
jgi:lipopolysaccharide/colanic/teichoic acid biosynthesis glycosyltransferase